MVIFDTNIIIDHLRKNDNTPSLFRKLVSSFGEDNCFITTISVQELYVGSSTKQDDKANTLLLLLSNLQMIEYDFHTAKLAGELVRDTEKLLTFADAAIAACAIINKFKLATLNRKDFQYIKDLELINLTLFK